MTTAIMPSSASTSTAANEEGRPATRDDTSDLSAFEYVIEAGPRHQPVLGSRLLIIERPEATSWRAETGGWLVMRYGSTTESSVKQHEIHLSGTTHLRSIPSSTFSYTTLSDVEHESAPGEYEWRDRFKQLRRWHGNAEQAEAREVSAEALDTAEWFCLYAERMLDSQSLNIPTVLAPLSSGGVHIEWTDRGPSWDHLEIGVPAEPNERFELLRTEETPSGKTLSSREVYDATLGEVLASLEQLIQRAKQRRSALA